MPESELAKFSSSSGKRAQQVADIAELITRDVESAKQMALVKLDIPTKYEPQILYNAVSNLADEIGDVQLMRDLANSPLATRESELGSGLQATGVGKEADSTVELIRSANKKLAKNAPTKNRIEQEAKAEHDKFRQAIKKARAPKQSWDEFVSEITCKD